MYSWGSPFLVLACSTIRVGRSPVICTHGPANKMWSNIVSPSVNEGELTRSPNMLDTAELTILVGLVRRAKRNAERRQERRQRLGKVSPGGDPGRTKAYKLARLQAKLEALLLREPVAERCRWIQT